MLAVGFDDFVLPDTRKNAMQPLFGHGIFATDGNAWSHSRYLLRPAMKKNNMAPLMRMMERHFQIMLKCIPAAGAAPAHDDDDYGNKVDGARLPGTAVDLQPLFFAFTMDTATEFLLGRSTHALDPERSSEAEAAFVRDYVSCCIEAVRRMRLSPLRPLPWTGRKTEAARRRAWAYIDGFVDDAIRVREEKMMMVMMNDMKQETTGAVGGEGQVSTGEDLRKDEDEDENNQDDNNDYSPDYNFLREIALDNGDRTFLRDQILNVLLAGRDTTAGLISSVFFVLARRPDIYQKLRAEVAIHFGDELPTQETLKRATYLDWCLKEG